MSEKKPYSKPVLTDLGPVSAGDLTELCVALRGDWVIPPLWLGGKAAAAIESLQREIERLTEEKSDAITWVMYKQRAEAAEARAAAMRDALQSIDADYLSSGIKDGCQTARAALAQKSAE